MNNYKLIELISYIIFITGFILWSALDISWSIFRNAQMLHFALSIGLTLLFIIPFIISHTKKHKNTLIKPKKTFRKRRQSFLGILIFVVLFILCISGTYLFLVGNRGGDMYGVISNTVHFYGSFMLIGLIIYHSYYLGRKGLKEDKKRLARLLEKEGKLA